MHRLVLFLACALPLTLASCKKKGDAGDTEVPTAGNEGGGEGPLAPDVPQDPDPPEIAKARAAYLLGNYAEVTGALPAIYEDLKSRSQYRASGLAGAWLAMAHARDVVEHGEEPATHAVAMATRTADPEVVCAGNMAMGAVALGLEKFDDAVKSLEAAVAASEAPAGDHALARVLLGEALIGRAFGPGGSNEIQNPQDMDAARKAYEDALGPAAEATEADLVLGRIHEGLAAVAKYQNRRADICSHAALATAKYAAAGVSEYLKEGPSALASAAKCEN